MYKPDFEKNPKFHNGSHFSVKIFIFGRFLAAIMKFWIFFKIRLIQFLDNIFSQVWSKFGLPYMIWLRDFESFVIFQKSHLKFAETPPFVWKPLYFGNFEQTLLGNGWSFFNSVKSIWSSSMSSLIWAKHVKMTLDPPLSP